MPMIEALRCAKCNASVKRWETWCDAETMDQVFKAFCHGEMDECRVSMKDIKPNDIVEAVAFRGTKALPIR